MMKKKIFITGATGFLGSYLLRELLDREDAAFAVLARSRRGETAAERVGKALSRFYETDELKALRGRVNVIDGEVEKKSFGIGGRIRKSLIEEVDEIYHSAAIAEFKVPLEKIREVNVKGAENVFEFAMECGRNGRLKKINHISTTYVAGTAKGVFCESDLDKGQGFNNTYEQSKYEAELLAGDYRKNGLAITIFRPSIITGDSVTGGTNNFKMLYQPLHFFAAELFDAIPADRNTEFNLIPVDFVAKAIRLIADEKESGGRTFHISNVSTVRAGYFLDVASDFFGFKKPEFIPLGKFDMGRLTYIQKDLIGPFIPYFNYNPPFDAADAKAVLEKKGLSYPVVDSDFLTKLFGFCAKVGFIRPKRHHVTAG